MSLSFWSGRRVLVTGAAGFLGSAVARSLIHTGAEVFGWVRPNSNASRLTPLHDHIVLQTVDITDRVMVFQAIANIHPDVVFHFAFSSGHPTQPNERANMTACGVSGTFFLLEALSEHQPDRIVCAGSFLELRPNSSPLAEGDIIDPVTFRGAVKAASTILSRQAARQFSLPLTILRLFTVFGPGESESRFIPTAIRAALKGKPLPLSPAGFRRDLVFVNDVVNAFLLTAEKAIDPGEIFHIGSGCGTTNEEIIGIIEHLCNRKIAIRPNTYPSRASDTIYCAADIRKANRILGWQPRTSLVEGITQEISWIQKLESTPNVGE